MIGHAPPPALRSLAPEGPDRRPDDGVAVRVQHASLEHTYQVITVKCDAVDGARVKIFKKELGEVSISDGAVHFIFRVDDGHRLAVVLLKKLPRF